MIRPLLQAITRLQDTLFSVGLKVVKYSYRETAGQASLLASRLTAEDEALLARIPLHKGTLLDAVRAWIDAGMRLGTLENERTRLMPEPTAPGTAARARGKWIRAVNAVRNLLEVIGTEDPVIRRILQRIADMETVAARRARRGAEEGPGEDEVTVPEPGDDEGESDPGGSAPDVGTPVTGTSGPAH